MSDMLHHVVETAETTYIFEELNLPPFDELIVSWNASRPKKGHYALSVRLLLKEWTPWIDYAVWGSSDQYTFHKRYFNCQTYQDIVEVLNGEKATGFAICIKAEGGASLKQFRSVHTSISCEHKLSHDDGPFDSIVLNVPGISQMKLPHERCASFCSPASMSAVIQYLFPSLVTPLSFAEQVRDSAFDIYGNWIFNTAQAAHLLGANRKCYVARLKSFRQIVEQLKRGNPVVVSVKGALPGAPLAYESGHLLVVKGFDKEVLCMDPAFPSDEATHVRYPLNAFLKAWGCRKGLAYISDSL